MSLNTEGPKTGLDYLTSITSAMRRSAEKASMRSQALAIVLLFGALCLMWANLFTKE